MEIVSNIALITINETMIVQLVSFLIFLFLLNRIMIRPLQASMRERSDYIKNVESSIKDSDTKLQDLQVKLKDEERAAIQEGNTQREQLEKDGSEEAEDIMTDFRKEILRIREDNQAMVNKQISEARKSLKTESETLATRIMEKILDRGVARG